MPSVNPYDLVQQSRERDPGPIYFNFGYRTAPDEPLAARQQRLCLEAFALADLRPEHRVVDVGFGSGEQDFLLLRTHPVAQVIGFNTSARQVEHARRRAEREGVAGRLDFRLGAAEDMDGVADESVDRVLAIECAFHFDRDRFYATAARVLRPGGLLVVADIAFADPLRRVAGRTGTPTINRARWERHFETVSWRSINREVIPGCQQSVFEVARHVRARRPPLEVASWAMVSVVSQLTVAGLAAGLIHYDLGVLRKPGASIASTASTN